MTNTETAAPGPNIIARPGPVDQELTDEQKRVLLVAAHPDDPEFSSGGTVARWVRAGIEVIYVVATSGDPLQFNEQIREGLEPHKVKEIFVFGTEQPNVLVDISETIEDKVEALKLHVSQVGTAEELAQRIKTRSAQTAEPHGLEYAE